MQDLIDCESVAVNRCVGTRSPDPPNPSPTVAVRASNLYLLFYEHHRPQRSLFLRCNPVAIFTREQLTRLPELEAHIVDATRPLLRVLRQPLDISTNHLVKLQIQPLDKPRTPSTQYITPAHPPLYSSFPFSRRWFSSSAYPVLPVQIHTSTRPTTNPTTRSLPPSPTRTLLLPHLIATTHTSAPTRSARVSASTTSTRPTRTYKPPTRTSAAP